MFSTAYQILKDIILWRKKPFVLKIEEEEITFEEKLRSLKMDVVKVNAHDHFWGVKAEYEWINKKYPGSKTGDQALIKKEFQAENGRRRVINFDLISVELKNGRQKRIYFETDSFFATEKPTSHESGYADQKLLELYSC